MNKRTLIAFLAVFIVFTSSVAAFSQEAIEGVGEGQPKIFEAKARAVSASTLSSGKALIILWGVQPVNNLPAILSERSRIALDDAIGNASVQCEYKSRDERYIYAQCLNREDQDLGLLMVQQGYASVDRRLVYDTLFEEPYLQAEENAQAREVGIWADQAQGLANIGLNADYLKAFALALVVGFIVLFGMLFILVSRGFRNIQKRLDQFGSVLGREEKIKSKERLVVANMIGAEIKANKAKIEAYLVVYEEMLSDLKNPQRQPKYKKAGDILQMQPGLERSVFDRNADKLQNLGNELSSQVIHFYARIKTKPDYVNLEPSMPLEDVVKTVEESLAQAKRLDEVVTELIGAFEKSGL